MSAEEFLTSADGTRLFVRRWDAFQPKAVCLLVHGLAEHSGRYEHLAQSLVRRRFFVWAMDHRGHGQSGGLPSDCAGLDPLVADLHLLVQKTAEAMPHLPRILIGHSLGGLIALAYAVGHPEGIRAVAVSSPALQLKHPTPDWKVRMVTATSYFFPAFPFQNGVNPAYLCHDPTVVQTYQQDPLVHRTITARCAVELNRAMKSSLALAGPLRVPCLILQAGGDEVCDPAAAQAFARAAQAASVDFRLYDGLYHELFNEPEKDRVIEDLVRWLEEVLR